MLFILLRRFWHHRQVTWLFSFAALIASSFVWLPIPASVAAPIADANAYVTANVNLRAGPDTDYPAVVIIPAQDYVTIYACIEDLTWCDVSYGENRGWVSAQYIQPFYQDRYMTVQEYAPLVSLPTAPFDIKLYWSSYYSGQPFYGELDQWAAPRPAFRTSSFYEPLGSYGDWVQKQDQYVWVPRDVDQGWRPYTRGHWVNTDQYGWFWSSDEPFGWATYHYGRWGFSHDVGWFWVPGTRWAPAWVAWRGSDNYLGWAPLPPAPDDGLSVSISIGSVPDYYWQVVPAQSFLAVDLSVQIVHDENVFRPAFEETRPLGNVTIVNNVVVNKVVNINYVEQKTHRKVVVEKVAAAGTADAAGKNAVGKIAVFAPPAKGRAAPAKLKKIEEVALVSKTKAQAGRKPAMDLATLQKLKGPSPGKKAKAGPPSPPPPASLTASAKTLNAAKAGGQPCPPGALGKGHPVCVGPPQPAARQQALQLPGSPKCTGGHVLAGNQCVCPPGMTGNGRGVCISAQQPAAERALARPGAVQCTGGHVLVGNQCQCPPGTAGNGRGVCIPAQQVAAAAARQRALQQQQAAAAAARLQTLQQQQAAAAAGRQKALQQQQAAAAAARLQALQQQQAAAAAARQQALQQQQAAAAAARQRALLQQQAATAAARQQTLQQQQAVAAAARVHALQQQQAAAAAARQRALLQQQAVATAARLQALQHQQAAAAAARLYALQQQQAVAAAARQGALLQQQAVAAAAARQRALLQQQAVAAAARQQALQQQQAAAAAAHQQALQHQQAAGQQCPPGMIRNGKGVCRPRG